MASPIKLPTRISGGSSRRRSAVGPTAENVPNVAPASDPGVSIPDFSQFAGAGAEIGEVLGAHAASMEKAETRMRNRREALLRAQILQKHRAGVNEDKASLAVGETAMSPDAGQEFKSSMAARTAESTEAGKGMSEEGRLILARELVGQNTTDGDAAAKTIVTAQNQFMEDIVDQEINKIAVSLDSDQSGLLSSFLQVNELFKSTNLGGNISANVARDKTREAHSKLVGIEVDKFVRNGDFAEARNLISEAGIVNSMGLENARDAEVRINTAEDKARQEDRINFSEFKAAELAGLFPSMSREEQLTALGAIRPPAFTAPPQETAFLKGLGQADAEFGAKLITDARTARGTLTATTRVRAALESGSFTPGSFGQARLGLARFLEFVNAPAELRRRVGSAQTGDVLDAASQELALAMSSKLSRITNKTFGAAQDAVPNLMRTPEGNLILVEIMERAAQREIQLASLFTNYRKVGNDDLYRAKEGGPSFYDQLADLENNDPVISDELRVKIANADVAGAVVGSFEQQFKNSKEGPPDGFVPPAGWRFLSRTKDGKIRLEHLTETEPTTGRLRQIDSTTQEFPAR